MWTCAKSEQLIVLKLITDNESMLNTVRYKLRIEDQERHIDDQERYLKMMMKLDPYDPHVLERNRNNIALVCYEIRIPNIFKIKLSSQ